jgi:hypothetical protein
MEEQFESKTYLKGCVLFVSGPLLGVKSGSVAGTKSFTAHSAVVGRLRYRE